MSEEFLNSQGWFYAGEPQVNSNYVKGKFRMRYSRNFNEKGSVVQISAPPVVGEMWVDKFYGYINSEEDFLTIERLIKYE